MKPSGNATHATGDVFTATKINNVETALKALEVLTSAPAASVAGRLVLVTADGRIYRDTGAAVAALALLTDVTSHTGRTDNPHSVTAAQAGALATSARGAANGVASLDAGTLVPLAQIPATLTGKSADQVDGYHAGNASGQVPVSNGTVNTNLNAEKLGGETNAQVKAFAIAMAIALG